MVHSLIRFFEFAHLPEHLQPTSAPFYDVACSIDAQLPNSEEKTAGLRKLLEAKDCIVRAAVAEHQKPFTQTTEDEIALAAMEKHLNDANADDETRRFCNLLFRIAKEHFK